MHALTELESNEVDTVFNFGSLDDMLSQSSSLYVEAVTLPSAHLHSWAMCRNSSSVSKLPTHIAPKSAALWLCME